MQFTKTHCEELSTLNTDTGEVSITRTETTTTHTERTKEPDFVKLYLDHLALFNGTSLNINPILAELLKRATYADDPNGAQQIVINKAVKKQIASKLQLAEGSINNAITEFVKNDYLRRIDRGLYIANPNYFGKGDWGNIKKLRANYDYINHTMTAEIKSEYTEEQ